MSGKMKSQWDFSGELFPSAQMRRVFSVSEVTATVRRLLEERVGAMWVTGEISNLRAQNSGHLYFSLKDANAQLACVCFRDEARATRHLLKDGQKVVLHGEMTVYEARGQYQLLVDEVELEGLGALQAAFERLKQKLDAEGLFAPERKRPIPELPQRIGVVSSLAGAALRDVLHVVARRQPSLEILLAACRVQGQGAADEIVCAIQSLNEWAARGHRLDLILVTRGGGSLEDLWAFNEETVARAIFQSRLPVMSAVGHEIDFTISDFVADLRAATPSAAAELITEGMFRKRESISQAVEHLVRLVRERVAADRENVQRLARQLARAHPRRWLKERVQRLDDLSSSVAWHAGQALRRQQSAFLNLTQRLGRARPSRLLPLRGELLEDAWRRLLEQARHAMRHREQRLRLATSRLRLLSLEHILERGFSITRDAATGHVLRSVDQMRTGQRIITRLRDGDVSSVVETRASSSTSEP